MEIILQDKHMIVCQKPVGIASQPDSKGNDNMITQLSQYLTTTEASTHIFPIHRLDKPVAGVMVFARTQPAAAALSKAVQTRTMEKTYLAVVCGIPEHPQGTLQDLLYHDARRNKTYVVDRPRKGVKEAILTYETLETVQTPDGVLTVLQVQLRTGRTHQIRVQFASRSLPLYGDKKYGAEVGGNLIGLFAKELTFPHPATQKRGTYTATVPQTLPWTVFSL